MKRAGKRPVSRGFLSGKYVVQVEEEKRVAEFYRVEYDRRKADQGQSGYPSEQVSSQYETYQSARQQRNQGEEDKEFFELFIVPEHALVAEKTAGFPALYLFPVLHGQLP